MVKYLVPNGPKMLLRLYNWHCCIYIWLFQLLNFPTRVTNKSSWFIDLSFTVNASLITDYGIKWCFNPDSCNNSITFGKMNLRVPLPSLYTVSKIRNNLSLVSEVISDEVKNICNNWTLRRPSVKIVFLLL